MTNAEPESATKAEERGLERLILFSDAVVAIAITLLVLPLTDLRPDDGESVWTFLSNEYEELLAFAISFLVIARFWTTHHAMFKDLIRMDKTLMIINTGWLASVVLLPFPTGLLDLDGGYSTLYLVNLLATSGCTTALGLYIGRHPELLEDPSSAAAERRGGRFFGLVVSGTVVVALIGSFFWESRALLLLLLTPLLGPIVMRLTGKKTTD